MKRLDQRLAVLEEVAPDFLMDYYEPRLHSFSIAPGTADEFSITSTAYSVRALLEYPERMKAAAVPATMQGQGVSREESVRALLGSKWRERDLYQVTLVLLMVLRLDPDLMVVGASDAATVGRFARLVTLALSGRPQRRAGENQRFSSYISYLCTSCYVALQASVRRDATTGQLQIGSLSVEAIGLPDGTLKDLTQALARAAEISFNELCRQLAYRTAGDSGSFDIIKLVYSLLSYLKATESLQGTAGREVLVPATQAADVVAAAADGVDGGYDYDGGGGSAMSSTTESVKKVNRRLVQAALEAFFQEQNERDGLWDRGQPIYRSFHRQGRNVGNAYVFALDALGSLLEFLPAEEFRPYLSNLERALTWIEQNEDVEVVSDYCDPESGRCYGKMLRGWTSPYLSPRGGPKAWATAQTVTCLARMRRIVRQLMHNDVLEEFRGVALSKNGPSNQAWDRLLDSDLGEPDGGRQTNLKQVLETRVCVPFEQSVSAPSVGAAYSTILFGSPGTAKTTITEAVAEKMGWDFVVIDTAAFLADGLTNVASRIRYVFTRLQALRCCVILFDEIEEFCLDREAPGISMESRMLTTAMLTAINDLRRTKQSVFFVATNRLRAFDAAIIRPGRFDMQLFVGTPNLEARAVLLEEAMAGSHISAEARAGAMDSYRTFLQDEWERDAMFMNYLECKQFATSVAKLVASSGGGRPLDRDELKRMLSQQAAVMTARGSVREEYVAQMDLSRL